MMEIILWIIGVYLALGIVTTIVVSNSPYSENGWIVTTLCWPLFWIAMVG